MKEKVLQLSGVFPSTQKILDETYEVHVPPEGEGQAEWLATHGGEFRAVVTSGHHGIAPAVADKLPQLAIVAINGVGYDRVDLDAMAARGVRVTNTPDVLSDDVADLAIALMLNVMRQLPASEQHVREGLWPAGSAPLARRASGRRYGIVGLGRIGQAIAKRLAGFGGSIAYTSQTPKESSWQFHADVQSLAAASEVLFVATASSAKTRGLIDRGVLEALGPQGVLVNIARGAIVDEDALVSAITERRIWGAGLDVFVNEPHVPEALRRSPYVALAPHVGSATSETRAAMGQLMLDNLAAFFAGRPLLTPVV